MQRIQLIRFISFCIILSGIVFAGFFIENKAEAFSTGAPAAHCGAPADSYENCTQCHSSFPVNSVSNAITSNIPTNGYVPLTTYTITATINKPGHSRYGFEISPQNLSGNLLGSMNDISSETTFTGLGKYITHSTTGTSGINSKTWQFEWTAPAAGTGDVTFYGAFNVTNDDGGPVGDSIFMTTYTVNEDISNSISQESAVFTGFKYWVDVQHELHVSYRSSSAFSDRIVLTDLNGRVAGSFSPVRHVDGTSELNTDISTLENGIYFITVENGFQHYCSKLLIVK